MHRTLLLFLLVLTIHSVSAAADKWTWIRRVATVAACVGAAGDIVTTYGFASRGGVESNPIYRGAGGQPRLGLLISTHAAACAGSFLAGEKLRFRGSDVIWSVTGTALAAQYLKASAANTHIR